MDGIVTSSEFNNLKQDLLSIHDTIGQMFGKVGSLQTKSWKLREESGDLPVELLCNKCQYFSSDLHSTRASHIMLLELIIDRLALMIQSYTYFTDRLVGRQTSRIMDTAPNLGPLCKKYWKRAKGLRQFVTSLQTEIAQKNQELCNIGLTLEQQHEENLLLKDMVVKHGLASGYETPLPPRTAVKTPPKTAGSVMWSEFSGKREESDMADSAVDMIRSSATSLMSNQRLPTQITVNNMRKVSKWLVSGGATDAKTQTIETAFVECNVCTSIQDLLETMGRKLTMVWNLLNEKGVPPKRLIMAPPREAIKWCEAHISTVTDIDVIVRDVKSDNTELKGTCSSQHNRIIELEGRIALLDSELNMLRSSHSSSITDGSKREEMLRQEISRQAVEYHHNMEHQKIENQRSKESIASLEKKLSDFQNKYFTEVTAKREVLEELERVRHEAQEADKARASCEELRDSIETLKHQHNASLDELNRYQSRNDQLIRQNKMLTVKQGQLLQQLEAFDSECELMREQLEASQDRSINANNELSEVSQQKARLNNENNKLQDAISRIQNDISHLSQTLNTTDKKLEEAHRLLEDEREKESTLINFPLLCEGERIPKELNRLVEANNIRILRLEEQNRLLRDTALQQQLRDAHPDPKQEPKPQPLWNNKCFKELIKSQHVFERVFTPIDYYDGINSLVDAHGRPDSCPDKKRLDSVAEGGEAPNNSPHPTPDSKHLGWTDKQRVNYSCHTCCKSFNSNSDLEIHQIYCE